MFWEDVLLSRLVNPPRLARALRAAFAVPARVVAVVDDIEAGATTTQPGARVLAQRTIRGGEFPTQVSIFLRDPEVERRATQPTQKLRTIRRLGTELECDCLVSDDNADPYTALRVRRTGELEQVELDQERLDEAGEYVVVTAVAVASPAVGA